MTSETVHTAQETTQPENVQADKQVNTEREVLVVHIGGQVELFDLELAKQREAQRRLTILGLLIQKDLDKQKFREHAQAHFLPERALSAWKHAFRLSGFQGLVPHDWETLSERSLGEVTKRITQLGPSLIEQLAQGKGVSIKDICDLAIRHEWTPRKAERLVRRYQINGLWGLAPEYDPERVHRQRAKPAPPDLAEASAESREIADKRYELIKDFLNRKHIPNKELKIHAEKQGSSLRTLRKYLRDYRTEGMRGLLPREERADKGKLHNMSPRMEGVVAGLRFSQRDLPVREVYERACPRARLLGEPEPTLWQVRQVCDNIADQVKEIADERYGDYRSKHRMTYRYFFDGSIIVYQIDFTRVDVLLKDIRPRGFRTKSGETRAYLITCVECSSRLVMGYLFTYDTPNSADIAKVLHMALTVSDNKPYGGIPDAVWVDGGKQLTSNHMHQIAKDLKFELREGKPNFSEDHGDPQKRGRAERPYGTFNTRLWSTLHGYTDSNTKERHPDVKGTLTISDLAAKFREFLKKYHHEEHSETKQTPMAFWTEHCFPRSAPPSEITLLLQERHERTVSKGFIQYAGRRYWHDDLYAIPADAKVGIRVQPDYMRPDDIEVIYQDHWVCTAFALESEAGRKVDGKRVLTAQRQQRRVIQQVIDVNEAVLQQVDQQIANQTPPANGDSAVKSATPQEEKHTVVPPVVSRTKRSSPSKTPSPDMRKPTGLSTTPAQAKTAWDLALEAKRRQKRT